MLTDEFVAEVNAAIDEKQVETPADETQATEQTTETEKSTTTGANDETEIEADEQVASDETTTEESEAAKPRTPAVSETPAAPKISDDILTLAVKEGMSLKDARAFASDESLRNVINIIRASKPDAKSEEKSEDDPLAALPKLDPEQYEPEVVKMFDSLVGAIRKQQETINAFKAQAEQAARSSQESAARDVEKWFDERVASLGEDFHEALGSGGYGALDRGSPQFAKREAIASQVAVLLAGYKAAGKEPPPRDQVFDAAAQLVLKDEFQKAHEKKLASDLAKRAKQHINRAGGQKVKHSQDPLEETAALLDEKYFK